MWQTSIGNLIKKYKYFNPLFFDYDIKVIMVHLPAARRNIVSSISNICQRLTHYTKHFTTFSLLFISFSQFAQTINATAPDDSQSIPDGGIPNELKLFQQMPLVITAARKPQRITEAPATIDVITTENIKHLGASTLTELLERLPGIYTPTAHNGLDMLWIRGVGGRFNDNALLLIDGIPYRTLYFSNFPINEQIPLLDIDKIEIIRGPGSALYGTNAFTGVVNIITKDATDIRKNVVSTSFGSFNTEDHHVLYGQEFDSGQISAFARYLDGDGYAPGRDDEGKPSNEKRDPKNHAYKLKLNYHNFDLNLRYSRFSINKFTAVTDDEEGDEAIREHFLSQLGYHHEFGKHASLQIKAYYNQFNLNKSGVAHNIDGSIASFNETEIYGRIAGIDVLSTINFSNKHTLLFGLNFEYEFLDHAWEKTQKTLNDPFEFTSWATASNGDVPESIDNNNLGIYLEDELKIGKKFILTSGLRFDEIEASDSRFSPRISVVYTPDYKTSLKLRYGEAFRAPTYQELFKRTQDGEAEGNQNLKPQIIKTTEFELSRFLSDQHRLNATLYFTEIEKFIKIIGDGDFENIGEQEFYGFELGLNGQINNWLSYFSNFSFTIGKQKNRNIGGIPEYMGNFGLTYTGNKYVDITAHLRYVGDRNRPANYQTDVSPSYRQNLLDSYRVVNLNFVLKNLPNPFNASISIRNLFNETHYTSGEQTQDFDIQQPGRRIHVNISWEF